MSTSPEFYSVHYIDAPFLLREETAQIFVNLRMYVGDFLLSTQFVKGSEDEPDILTYIIQQTPHPLTQIISIPESIEVTPGSKLVQVELRNNEGLSLLPEGAKFIAEYGANTYNEPPGLKYNINYLAAPYHNASTIEGGKMAYVIVNMPAESTDQFVHTFTPNIATDTDGLIINVAKGQSSTGVTYCKKLGPFGPVSLEIEVQVCVNGTASAGPKVIKSYGQGD